MSQEELVYLNGQLIPANQASIAIYDAAVVLGATLTDMERTFNQQIFQLDQHIERFYRSCKFARIEPAESKLEGSGVSTTDSSETPSSSDISDAPEEDKKGELDKKSPEDTV